MTPAPTTPQVMTDYQLAYWSVKPRSLMRAGWKQIEAFLATISHHRTRADQAEARAEELVNLAYVDIGVSGETWEQRATQAEAKVAGLVSAITDYRANYGNPVFHDKLDEILKDPLPAATRLLNEVEALRAAQMWQPIETAPRSTFSDTPHGPDIKCVCLIGYVPNKHVSPESSVEIIYWEPLWRPELRYADPERAGAWVSEGAEVKPTHWLPLPEPPLRAQPQASTEGEEVI